MKKTVLAAAGLLTLALGAKATIITQEQSYSAQTAWNQGLSFNQFDPTLGTLNSVTINLAGNAQLATSVNNNSLGALTFGINDDFTFAANIPGGPLMLSKEVDQLFFVGLGATAGETTLGTVSQNETLNGDLSAWEGLGSIVLPADASDSFSYNMVTGNTVSVGGTAGLDASVSYDYTAVPEGPLPLWSSCSGILAVFWLAKKKLRLPTAAAGI